MAICELTLVRMMLLIWPTRSDPTAATISTAARVGIATTPTTPDSATRITSIQIPAKIEAQRSTAPALTLIAVWPTEPPTGMPLKKPDARLPTPWAMKSRSGLEGDRSRLGADSATPAP